MDLVVRAAVIFAALWIIMRAAGNRQFSELTAFDAVLIIVIAEVTGNSLSGNDYSLTASIVVITTLVGLDLVTSALKRRFPRFEKVAEGVPIVLVQNGQFILRNLRRERVSEDDVLSAARVNQGIEHVDDIRYAVLETDGEISIIPRKGGGASG